MKRIPLPSFALGPLKYSRDGEMQPTTSRLLLWRSDSADRNPRPSSGRSPFSSFLRDFALLGRLVVDQPLQAERAASRPGTGSLVADRLRALARTVQGRISGTKWTKLGGPKMHLRTAFFRPFSNLLKPVRLTALPLMLWTCSHNPQCVQNCSVGGENHQLPQTQQTINKTEV